MNIPDINSPGNLLRNNETRLAGATGTNRQDDVRNQQVQQNQNTNPPARQPEIQETAASPLVNIRQPIINRQNAREEHNVVGATPANNNIPTGPRNENPQAQPTTENPVPTQERFDQTAAPVNQNPNNDREPVANNERTLQAERLRRQLFDQQTTTGENRNRTLDLLA